MKLSTLLTLCWAATLTCNCLAAGPTPIRFTYVDIDSSPFQVGKGDAVGNPPGLAVELVRQGVTSAGYVLELQRLPQLRMLKALESGETDAAFIFSYTPERAQLYVYPMKDGQPDSTLRLTNISYRLYGLKGGAVTWDGQKIERLQSPIGVNTGWVMAKTLRDKGYEVDDGGRGYAENMAKLRTKRIAAYVGLEVSTDGYLKHTGMDKWIEKIGPPFQAKDYFVLFSKRFYASNPDAANAIWRAIAKARERNEAALYQKYQDVSPQ